MSKKIDLKHTVTEGSFMDILCLIVCILGTLLVIWDFVKRSFTPITIVIDILILVVDVYYIVKFIKRHKK